MESRKEYQENNYEGGTPQDLDDFEVIQLTIIQKLEGMPPYPMSSNKKLQKEQITDFIIQISCIYHDIYDELMKKLSSGDLFKQEEATETPTDDLLIEFLLPEEGIQEEKQEQINQEEVGTLIDQILSEQVKLKFKDFLDALSKPLKLSINKVIKEIQNTYKLFEKELFKEGTQVPPEYLEEKVNEFRIIKNMTYTNSLINIIDMQIAKSYGITLDERIHNILFQDSFKLITDQISQRSQILLDLIFEKFQPMVNLEYIYEVKAQTKAQFQLLMNYYHENIQNQIHLADQISIILNSLTLSNLPCSKKRFLQLQTLIDNVISKFGLNERENLKIEVKILEEAKDTQIVNLGAIKKANKEKIKLYFQQHELKFLMIFVYLAGTNSINFEGEICYNTIPAYQRDILLRFFKFTLDKKYEYYSAFSQIEQCLREAQLKIWNTIQIAELKSKLEPQLAFDINNKNISEFLFDCHKNKDKLIQDQSLLLDYLYQGDQGKIDKQKQIFLNAIEELQIIMIQQKNKLPQCILHQIDQEQQQSKHVQIAFSGFLSYKDKHNQSWEGLSLYLQNQGIQSYCVEWESIDIDYFVKALLIVLCKVAIYELFDLLNPAKIAKAAKIITAIIRAKRYTVLPLQEINKLFQEAKRNAKLTGKLVAIALALGYPFRTQTISLVGFSLGTQVIKSCLRKLNKIGANDIIHNVTLLGGAAKIRIDDAIWNDVLSTTVNGILKNVYTSKDIILILYRISQSCNAIGRKKLFDKCGFNLANSELIQESKAYFDGQTIRVKNYNISSLIFLGIGLKTMGHMYYRRKLFEVMEHIKIER